MIERERFGFKGVCMTMGRGCVLRVLLTFTEGVSVRQVHPLCALMTSQEVTLLRVPITPITLSSSWRTMGVCVCSVSLCVCVCVLCVCPCMCPCVYALGPDKTTGCSWSFPQDTNPPSAYPGGFLDTPGVTYVPNNQLRSLSGRGDVKMGSNPVSED